MRRLILGMTAFVAAIFFSNQASAGPSADSLNKCLMKSTSEGDRVFLVQWMFAVISVNPALGEMTSITPDQRQGYNQRVSALAERLMLTDCRTETVEAFKEEGPSVLETGFNGLIQAAARGLLSDPATTAEMMRFAKSFNTTKWAAFRKEAGLSGAGDSVTPKPN